MTKPKPCKKCLNSRYLQSQYCFKHFRETEKQKKIERLEKKKAKHETTKVYQEKVAKKLMRENDRLFQELGRKLYRNCYFGHEYSCLHHWTRKSQSLFTRYDIENGIPVCAKCHCLIHQAQDSTLEARFIIDKGEDWLNRMTLKKNTIVHNKLEFLQEKNKALKLALGINQV